MKCKLNKGITLISLVITIVIMLILAGVSINLIIGNNGLFKKAKNGTEMYEISSIKEQIQNDLLAESANEDGVVEENAIKVILEKYGVIDYESDGTIKGITTSKNVYIDVTDILDSLNVGASLVADGSWSVKNKVNTPKIMEGMTPIYLDAIGKEVEVTKDNQKNWYNYENKQWANAKTEDGSLWVWIPRFEYKINSDQTINIKFIPTSKVDKDDDYSYIHPAFRNGTNSHFMNGEWNEEIPGFWVAKYTAGFQASTTSSENSSNIVNATDAIKYSEKKYTQYNSSFTTNALGQNLSSGSYSSQRMSYPVFKPLTYTYNVMSIGDMYTLGLDINKAQDFYGLNKDKTDSHMMKNSEWGAVAYLAQSSCGRNKEKITANNKDFNITSKKIHTITGYAGDTPNGVGAGSTNNLSGVFDLNGGAVERVTAYITNGNPAITNSGSSFACTTSKDANAYRTGSTKYATVYPFNSSSDSYQNNWIAYNKLKSDTYGHGDAILETSTGGTDTTAWQNAYSSFITTTNPFMMRGGAYSYGDNSGLFAFNTTNGLPNDFNSFRAVLIDIE